jgi:hypothetical protein
VSEAQGTIATLTVSLVVGVVIGYAIASSTGMIGGGSGGGGRRVHIDGLEGRLLPSYVQTPGDSFGKFKINPN